ncbi:ATP-binding domain-containing protein [Micromonospora sp. Llam7]|uniref:HelD family protein n=1 Tax=Micromonospora tarapacensis TaxID=2835305 RepID=UPI001C836788|nr:ATP-binding domain-containing protein [Micromonospora tarapacensis]
MGSKSSEIANEQTFFDAAARHRARRRDGLTEVSGAAAHHGAAVHLKRYAETTAETLGGDDEAVAFGRIDDDSGDVLYIGRHVVLDEHSEVQVANWQAPAAAPYFEASHADPRGLVRKRSFQCAGNTVQDFADLLFAQLADAMDGPDQRLLDDLARARTGELRDIVATIQAAQFELIRAPMEQVLVIEGGPGTGKTAVALHRVSWLLFNSPDLVPTDVLVVGPNPTFMRYIGRVLPELGDAEVLLRDVARLAPDVRRGRTEPAEVTRLKGEARMAGLLSRALRNRVGVPEPAERLLLGGRFVTVPGTELAEATAVANAADLPYSQQRRLFWDRVNHLVGQRAGVDPAGAPAVANLVERLWPQQSAAAFLRDLFGSAARLRAAAGTAFTAEEVARLHRQGADRLSEEVWAAADLPLLDEVERLVDGPGRQYAHVVIDEAQDLSPMQLRAVGRRCASGSFTLIGDLAQSTGPWARDDWTEVTDHLPAVHPVTIAPLRYGYRVPAQAYRLAARVLPVAAAGVTPPEVVRTGPAEPGIHRVSLTERAGRVVALAAAHADNGAFVGIVCPARCRREVEAALADNGVGWSSTQRGELGGSVNLVSPQEAKGLEFDAVVVVEPEQIVAEDERGHRLLYVALTRTTAYLDIVCVADPLPMTVPPRPEPPAVEPGGLFTDRALRRLAEHLAGQVRGAAPRASWDAVLDEVRRALDAAERPG